MERFGKGILLAVGTLSVLTGAFFLFTVLTGPKGPIVTSGFQGVAEFGAWRLICAPAGGNGTAAEESAGTCRVNQEVAIGEEPRTPKDVVVAANIGILGPEKLPALVLRLPATSRRGDTIGLRLENGYEVKTSVRDCTKEQCLAAGNLSQDDWNRLRASYTGQIRLPAVNGQLVLIDLKFEGLAAALAAMQKAQAS